VISATNVDLQRRVRERHFREDLWFRLADEVITPPPLRERGDDVLFLARHFLRVLSGGPQAAPPVLPPEVEAALLAYPWPGNVRELRNAMRRVCVRAAGRAVAVEDLPAALHQRRPRRWGTLRSALRERETELIQEALARHRGVVARAAAELGLTRQGLWVKLRRLGLVVAGP